MSDSHLSKATKIMNNLILNNRSLTCMKITIEGLIKKLEAENGRRFGCCLCHIHKVNNSLLIHELQAFVRQLSDMEKLSEKANNFLDSFYGVV